MLHAGSAATPDAIVEFVKRAIDYAQQGDAVDYTLVGGSAPVLAERERSELVDYDAYFLGRRSLWMWEWYGKWRPLKNRNADAEQDDSKDPP